MAKKELVDIHGYILHETPAAVRFKYDDDQEPVWLPKSQIEVEEFPGEASVITLPVWLAHEKEML